MACSVSATHWNKAWRVLAAIWQVTMSYCTINLTVAGKPVWKSKVSTLLGVTAPKLYIPIKTHVQKAHSWFPALCHSSYMLQTNIAKFFFAFLSLGNPCAEIWKFFITVYTRTPSHIRCFKNSWNPPRFISDTHKQQFGTIRQDHWAIFPNFLCNMPYTVWSHMAREFS